MKSLSMKGANPKASLTMEEVERAREANKALRQRRQSVVQRPQRRSNFIQALEDSGELDPGSQTGKASRRDSRVLGQKFDSFAVMSEAQRTDSFDEPAESASAPDARYRKQRSKSILRNRDNQTNSPESMYSPRNASKALRGVIRQRSSVYIKDGEADQPVEDHLVGQFLTRIDGLLKKLEPDRSLPSHWEKRIREAKHTNTRSIDSFFDSDYGGSPYSSTGGLRGPSPTWQTRSYSARTLSPNRSPHFEHDQPQGAGPGAKRGHHVPTPDEEKRYLHREELRRCHELGLL